MLSLKNNELTSVLQAQIPRKNKFSQDKAYITLTVINRDLKYYIPL